MLVDRHNNQGMNPEELKKIVDSLKEQGHNTMRINFSYSNREEIAAGVERLATVIKYGLNAK